MDVSTAHHASSAARSSRASSPTAYVRFHGRNASTWNVRGKSAAERFDYLYGDDELREWTEPLRRLGDEAEQAFAFFNNNGRSAASDGGGWVAQAATNALALRGILEEEGVPVA